jgi:hypothetical protein
MVSRAVAAAMLRRASIFPECDAVYTSVLPPSARIYTAENDADLASGKDMVLGLTRFALVFAVVLACSPAPTN